MLRISLTELEELRLDPAAFKKRRAAGNRFFPQKSVFQMLRRAIYAYHGVPSDPELAMGYLERELENKIKSAPRREQGLRDLQWYITEHRSRAWPTVLHRHRTSVRLSVEFSDSTMVTGEINRIDMHPSGGYSVWSFTKGDAENWTAELRMPIIQNAVAVDLGVHPNMVHMGIYAFAAHEVHTHRFTIDDMRQAHAELEELLRMLSS